MYKQILFVYYNKLIKSNSSSYSGSSTNNPYSSDQ